MYRYFDPKDNSSFLSNDQTYKRITNRLDSFIQILSGEDKELLAKMMSESYHKHYKSIQSKSHGGTELIHSLIMALLLEQIKEIKELSSLMGKDK